MGVGGRYLRGINTFVLSEFTYNCPVSSLLLFFWGGGGGGGGGGECGGLESLTLGTRWNPQFPLIFPGRFKPQNVL